MVMMTKGGKMPSEKSELSHARVSIVSVGSIRPSPENDRLYRPVDSNDPAIISLAASIKEHGLREPIVVTLDGYILSGHRRYAACLKAGLLRVPVRVEQINRRDDFDKFLVLLKEYNRQRVKSLDEQFREAAMSVDPDEAYANLMQFRESKSRIDIDPLTITGTKTRCRISKAKDPFVKAIQQVLIDRVDFIPLSDRAIHYALLNDPPLKHASKPDSIYRNDAASYNALTELLTRLRIANVIRMDWIGDETRPVTIYESHRDTSTFLESEMEDFLNGYCRDLVQSQPNHIEIVCEKNTVQPICKTVACEYCIPLTSGRGFCSLPPRADMVKRFKASGKQKLVILVVSDHDPEGEEIAHSFARSIRDDFNIKDIHPIKVALTREQVEQYNLTPGGTAKAGSVNRSKFVSRYGEDVFELEALEPKVLQEILTDAIDSVLDIDAFNAEVEREHDDAAWLAARRKVICDSMATLDEGGYQ